MSQLLIPMDHQVYYAYDTSSKATGRLKQVGWTKRGSRRGCGRLTKFDRGCNIVVVIARPYEMVYCTEYMLKKRYRRARLGAADIGYHRLITIYRYRVMISLIGTSWSPTEDHGYSPLIHFSRAAKCSPPSAPLSS